MDRINKERADPVILRAWRELRNERWAHDYWGWLLLPTAVFGVIASSLHKFHVASDGLTTTICAWFLLAYMGILGIRVSWMPHSRRKVQLAIVLTIAAAVFLANALWFSLHG